MIKKTSIRMFKTARKNISGWVEYWKLKWRFYLSLLAPLLMAVAAAIWLLMTMAEKEGEYEEKVASLTMSPEENYQLALDTAADGQLEEARVMMNRLARLGYSADNPLGYAKAHMWMARDILPGFDGGFLWGFPLGSTGRLQADVVLDENERTELAQRHLAHAVALDPKQEQGALMLAASHVAQGNRNEAVLVLLDALTNERGDLPQLHIPLAHVLTMQGDDQQLKTRILDTVPRDESIPLKDGEQDVLAGVRYALSAVALKRYDIAAASILELQSQQTSDKPIQTEQQAQERSDEKDTGTQDAIKGVRMAFHYHRALHFYRAFLVNPSNGYQQVVDELAKVLEIQADCQAAIDTLTHIAFKDTDQKARIVTSLQKAMAEQADGDPMLRSKVALSLALLSPQQSVARKNHLEIAVTADSGNAEAMLQLAHSLATQPEPDYTRINQLAQKALPNIGADSEALCHYLLGLSYLRLENWDHAVTSLERCMSAIEDKRKVHTLLAEAYTVLGRPELVARHRELAGE